MSRIPLLIGRLGARLRLVWPVRRHDELMPSILYGKWSADDLGLNLQDVAEHLDRRDRRRW